MAKKENLKITPKVSPKVTKIFKSLRTYIISGILLIIFLTPAILVAEMFSGQENQEQEICLLLNSDLLDCEQASVKFILWTEENRETFEIEKIISRTGFSWEKQIISDYSGKKAFKYVTQMVTNKEEESSVLEKYRELDSKIRGTKVRLYLEETVASKLDPYAYFQANKIDMVQKVQTSGIISLSGFHPGLPQTVKAGKEAVNIQILTTNEVGTNLGKTLLAFPVFLEEF